MKKPIHFHGLLALKLTSTILAILLSSVFLLAQNSPKKKTKSAATASKKVEVKDKAIPSHRNMVKGKQKKHSKYQGDIETNN